MYAHQSVLSSTCIMHVSKLLSFPHNLPLIKPFRTKLGHSKVCHVNMRSHNIHSWPGQYGEWYKLSTATILPQEQPDKI